MNPPTPSTAPEWELLLGSLSCAPRATMSDRVRALVEPPVDWEGFLDLADHHGTSSLLYHDVSQIVHSHSDGIFPGAVVTALRRRYEINIQKSLILARELFRVLDRLEALGIEAIPYKGIVMAEAWYGDMALRQTGDLDLFIRRRDAPRIKDALRDLGFTPRLAISPAAEHDYIASGYEYTFDSPLGKNLLEAQWALQPRFYAVDFDMDGLFERAVHVTIAGRNVKTPSPEDLLLVLSVHAAKHVWARLIWLCDIARILVRENLAWHSVHMRARSLGIERILRITLLLTTRLLQMPLPEPLQNFVMADGVSLKLTDEIGQSIAAGKTYDEEQLSYFRLMLRLRERPSDRLLFLARLAFTPGPGEWEAVRLPGPLFSLYRVVRLGRLAARFARG